MHEQLEEYWMTVRESIPGLGLADKGKGKFTAKGTNKSFGGWTSKLDGKTQLGKKRKRGGWLDQVGEMDEEDKDDDIVHARVEPLDIMQFMGASEAV